MWDFSSLAILSAVFAWIGFTCGYFFRKWLEVSYLPSYQAHQREIQNLKGQGHPTEKE